MRTHALTHNQGGHLYGRRYLLPYSSISAPFLTHPQLQHAHLQRRLRDTRDYRTYGLRFEQGGGGSSLVHDRVSESH